MNGVAVAALPPSIFFTMGGAQDSIEIRFRFLLIVRAEPANYLSEQFLVRKCCLIGDAPWPKSFDSLSCPAASSAGTDLLDTRRFFNRWRANAGRFVLRHFLVKPIAEIVPVQNAYFLNGAARPLAEILDPPFKRPNSAGFLGRCTHQLLGLADTDARAVLPDERHRLVKSKPLLSRRRGCHWISPSCPRASHEAAEPRHRASRRR